MEFRIKPYDKIFLVTIIVVMTVFLIQPSFFENNRNKSETSSVRSFGQLDHSSTNNHYIYGILDNTSSVCPYSPCDGGW